MKINKLIQAGFMLILLGVTIIVMPSTASADVSKNTVSHDDVLSHLENFLSGHIIYSKVPHRTYSKRIMDSVSSDSRIDIRIVDRIRGKILKSDNFQVVLISNGKTIRRFELRGIIGIEVPIAIATRDLKRAERIDGAIEFMYRDLTGTPVRTPIYEGDDLTNRVVRANIQAGRELDARLLDYPDLVQRNDTVIVFLDSGGLTLTMIGKAMESGKLGDRIRVLNEKSSKTLICEITGEGEVEVI